MTIGVQGKMNCRRWPGAVWPAASPQASAQVQRQVMNSTITGKVVSGILDTAGTAVAGFRSDGYNFATGKYLNLVERINTRIATLINLSSL